MGACHGKTGLHHGILGARPEEEGKFVIDRGATRANSRARLPFLVRTRRSGRIWRCNNPSGWLQLRRTPSGQFTFWYDQLWLVVTLVQSGSGVRIRFFVSVPLLHRKVPEKLFPERARVPFAKLSVRVIESEFPLTLKSHVSGLAYCSFHVPLRHSGKWAGSILTGAEGLRHQNKTTRKRAKPAPP